jgi:hypothetical protein
MLRTCAALLAAAALAVAGCGGSGGEKGSRASSGGGRALTKAQFIAKATTVCRDTKQAQLPFTDKVNSLPDRTDLKRVAPLLVGALAQSRKGLTRLRAVPAPHQDKARLDAYFAAAERLLSALEDLANAAKASDRPAGAKVARETQALTADARQKAADYGLKGCGDVF